MNDSFKVTIGVRQDFILSTTLFILLLDSVMKSRKTRKERNTIDNDERIKRS